MDLEKLKKLKSKGLEGLTGRQKIAVQLALDGKTLAEIGKEMGCSKQNVSGLIKSAEKRLDASPVKKQASRNPKPANPPTRNPYQKYAHMDHSALTPREREAMQLRLSGKTYQQIADVMGVSISCVGVILQNARLKLDGHYEEKRKRVLALEYKRRAQCPEKTKASNKRSYQKHREKRVADMKEYNREYYQKNRERLLEKKRERRKKG